MPHRGARASGGADPSPNPNPSLSRLPECSAAAEAGGEQAARALAGAGPGAGAELGLQAEHVSRDEAGGWSGLGSQAAASAASAWAAGVGAPAELPDEDGSGGPMRGGPCSGPDDPVPDPHPNTARGPAAEARARRVQELIAGYARAKGGAAGEGSQGATAGEAPNGGAAGQELKAGEAEARPRARHPLPEERVCTPSAAAPSLQILAGPPAPAPASGVPAQRGLPAAMAAGLARHADGGAAGAAGLGSVQGVAPGLGDAAERVGAAADAAASPAAQSGAPTEALPPGDLPHAVLNGEPPERQPPSGTPCEAQSSDVPKQEVPGGVPCSAKDGAAPALDGAAARAPDQALGGAAEGRVARDAAHVADGAAAAQLGGAAREPVWDAAVGAGGATAARLDDSGSGAAPRSTPDLTPDGARPPTEGVEAAWPRQATGEGADGPPGADGRAQALPDPGSKPNYDPGAADRAWTLFTAVVSKPAASRTHGSESLAPGRTANTRAGDGPAEAGTDVVCAAPNSVLDIPSPPVLEEPGVGCSEKPESANGLPPARQPLAQPLSGGAAVDAALADWGAFSARQTGEEAATAGGVAAALHPSSSLGTRRPENPEYPENPGTKEGGLAATRPPERPLSGGAVVDAALAEWASFPAGPAAEQGAAAAGGGAAEPRLQASRECHPWPKPGRASQGKARAGDMSSSQDAQTEPSSAVSPGPNPSSTPEAELGAWVAFVGSNSDAGAPVPPWAPDLARAPSPDLWRAPAPRVPATAHMRGGSLDAATAAFARDQTRRTSGNPGSSGVVQPGSDWQPQPAQQLPLQPGPSGNPFAPAGGVMRGSTSALSLQSHGGRIGQADWLAAADGACGEASQPGSGLGGPALPGSVSMPSLSVAVAEQLLAVQAARGGGWAGTENPAQNPRGAWPTAPAQPPPLTQASAPPELAAALVAAAAAVPHPGRQPPAPPPANGRNAGLSRQGLEIYGIQISGLAPSRGGSGVPATLPLSQRPSPRGGAAPVLAAAQGAPEGPPGLLLPGGAVPAQGEAEAAAVAAWPPMSASDRTKCQRAYDVKVRCRVVEGGGSISVQAREVLWVAVRAVMVSHR